MGRQPDICRLVRRGHVLAAFFLLPLALSACGAKGRPAVELDEYEKYRGQTVTTLRPSLLNHYSEMPRGLRLQCLEPPPRYSLFQTFTARGGPGPATVERKIDAGETATINNVVRYKEVPGVVYLEARLDRDRTECIIPLAEGLQYRLVFTRTELDDFNRLPPELRGQIVSRQLRPGMKTDHVLLTLGVPHERIPGALPGTETWTYIPQLNKLIYLDFDGGELKGMRE